MRIDRVLNPPPLRPSEGEPNPDRRILRHIGTRVKVSVVTEAKEVSQDGRGNSVATDAEHGGKVGLQVALNTKPLRISPEGSGGVDGTRRRQNRRAGMSPRARW
jgi:hypothetical protein